MELRYKLLAANLVLVALMALVILFFVRTVFPPSILSDLQRYWIHQTEELAEEAVNPLLGKDALALRMLVFQCKDIMENAEYIFIADRDGNILAHTFPKGFPTDFRRVMAGKRDRVSRREILFGAKPVFDIAAPVLRGDMGEVHIGFSAEPVMRETNRITVLIICTVLGALALQVLFMIILEAVIIKPIAHLKQLAVQVRQIGRGQFGEIISVTSRDEVGELARAYNEMRGDLFAYQRRLRLLATQLSLAEEQERRRIAAQVHDHIGQTMALAKIKLRSLQEKATAENIKKEVEDIYGIVETVIQDTRALIFELSPPILYELGLAAALEWLCDHMAKTYGLPIEFVDDDEPKHLKEDVSVFCFQVGRELLMNVVKHARATRAVLSLQRKENCLLLTVEDNGTGVDVSWINHHAAETVGFGLFSIRERLKAYGGTVAISAHPGSGARVSVVVNLET